LPAAACPPLQGRVRIASCQVQQLLSGGHGGSKLCVPWCRAEGGRLLGWPQLQALHQMPGQLARTSRNAANYRNMRARCCIVSHLDHRALCHRHRGQHPGHCCCLRRPARPPMQTLCPACASAQMLRYRENLVQVSCCADGPRDAPDGPQLNLLRCSTDAPTHVPRQNALSGAAYEGLA
jgi:hypothetical protein